MSENNIVQHYNKKHLNINVDDKARLNQIRNEIFQEKKRKNNFGLKNFAYSFALVASVLVVIPQSEKEIVNIAQNTNQIEVSERVISKEDIVFNASHTVTDSDFVAMFNTASDDFEVIDVLF